MGREYRVPRRRILRTELKLEEEDYAKTATKLQTSAGNAEDATNEQPRENKEARKALA